MDFVSLDTKKRYKLLLVLARTIEMLGLENYFKINAFIKEAQALREDQVMKLLVAREWFRLLKVKLLETYPLMEKWDTCAIEFICKEIEENSFEKAFFVTFGDISYLNLVNKLGGHLEGNNFLSRVANAFIARQSGDVISGRFGGDEIVTLLTNTTDNDVRKFCDAIEEDVSAKSYIVGGKNITPQVDLGRSELQESLYILYELQKVEQAPPPQGRISFIINTLITLADIRADFYKRLRRIHTLVELYDQQDYQVFVGFMRKGAGNITDEKIEELRRERELYSEQVFNELVLKTVLSQLTTVDPNTENEMYPLLRKLQVKVALEMFIAPQDAS